MLNLKFGLVFCLINSFLFRRLFAKRKLGHLTYKVKSNVFQKSFQKSDKHILGDSDFVEDVLSKTAFGAVCSSAGPLSEMRPFLEEKAVSSGSMNNTTYLNSFDFDNIKHEVLVNN